MFFDDDVNVGNDGTKRKSVIRRRRLQGRSGKKAIIE